MEFENNNKSGAGRPMGSKNKHSLKIKESFADLIEKNLGKLTADLDSLDSKDRLRFIIDLASYVIPKLKAIDLIESEQTNDFQNVTIQFVKND